MIEDNSLGLEFKYLIVNDMDRKFGLWVNTVGYQSIPPDSPYPLKEHPSGYFFNAEKGRVLLWGIERSGFFNGREKWAKGFENQRV